MVCPGLLSVLLGVLTLVTPTASEPHVSPVVASLSAPASRQRVVVRGVWNFALDREGRGDAEEWYKAEASEKLTERTPLPTWWGGKGTPIPWDTSGVVWLGKKIKLPQFMKGRRLVIHGPGIWCQARFWLNGQAVGSTDLPGLPYELNITEAARPGEENWLVCAIDNRVRENGFKAPAFEVYPWGGMSGLLTIEERDPRVEIEIISLRPTGTDDQVEITTRVRRIADSVEASAMTLEVSIRRELSELRDTLELPVAFPESSLETTVRATVTMKEPAPWGGSPEAIFQVAEAELRVGDQVIDDVSWRSAPRRLSHDDQWVTLDGHPCSIRGATDFGIFLSRYPPSIDGNENRGALGAMERIGLNMVRCLGFIPPKEYLEAASSLGMFVWLELPIPDGETLIENPQVETYLKKTIELARKYPCVMAVTLAQSLPKEGAAADRARALLAEARRETDHCFFFGAPDWGPAQDPQVPIEFIDLPLAMRLGDVGAAVQAPAEKPGRPVIVRNVGGYGTLPDFFHQRGALRRDPSALPPWLMEVKDNVRKQDPGFGSFQRLSLASDRVRSTCLLRELDQIARQDWLAGLEIQTFTDAPLPLDQPLSHVGVANWYAWPKAGTTIRLLQPVLGNHRGSIGLDRFVYLQYDEMKLRPQLQNTGRDLMAFDGYSLALLEEDSMLTDVKGDSIAIDPFTPFAIDPVSIRVPTVGWTSCIEVRGLFALGSGPENNIAFRESIWVVPAQRLREQKRTVARSGDATSVVEELYPFVKPVGTERPQVLITTEIDDLFFEMLGSVDGRVLLLGDAGGKLRTVPSTFEPKPGGPLGAWVKGNHPFFSSYFPVEPFLDMWAYDLVDGGRYYVLDKLTVRPEYLIRGIHAGTELWASLIEIKVGPGRLLACSLDLLPELGKSPIAAGLMDRLIHYAASDEFRPKALIQKQSFRQWIE